MKSRKNVHQIQQISKNVAVSSQKQIDQVQISSVGHFQYSTVQKSRGLAQQVPFHDELSFLVSLRGFVRVHILPACEGVNEEREIANQAAGAMRPRATEIPCRAHTLLHLASSGPRATHPKCRYIPCTGYLAPHADPSSSLAPVPGRP
jgi:hypothetical protein